MTESITAVQLLNDQEVIERVFHHIDNKSTDLGDTVWQEPVDSYQTQARFEADWAFKAPPSALLPFRCTTR